MRRPYDSIRWMRPADEPVTAGKRLGRVHFLILRNGTQPMNTAELVDKIAAHDDKITKTQAKAIVDGVFNAIRDAAKKGEEVSLPGFGKFKVQSKPARTGRNPSTGAAIQIAASKKVVFQAAKVLKDAVNG